MLLISIATTKNSQLELQNSNRNLYYVAYLFFCYCFVIVTMCGEGDNPLSAMQVDMKSPG